MNLGYEGATSSYEIIAKLYKTPWSGLNDWTLDTAYDMAAVMYGWENASGNCAKKFIPSECHQR